MRSETEIEEIEDLYDDSLKPVKMPAVLSLSEILLAVILFRYLVNFTNIVSPTSGSVITMFINVVSILISMTMTIFTVSAILGLASSRMKSWRKVVRSSILLFFTNLLYWFLGQLGLLKTGLVFPIELVGVLVVVVIVLMFLEPVRVYYTPPLFNVPPLKRWVRYAFGFPLIRASSYEFIRRNDMPEEEEEEVIIPPDGFRQNIGFYFNRAFTPRCLFGLFLALCLVVMMAVLLRDADKYMIGAGFRVILPYTALLSLFIPVWAVTAVGNTSVDLKKGAHAMTARELMGRYLGSFFGSMILITPVFLVMMVASLLMGYLVTLGNMDQLVFPFMMGYAVLLAFMALALSMDLLFNLRFKHASAMTFLVLFIAIPLIVYLVVSNTALIDMETIAAYVPLLDHIDSTMTGGFGGFTVMTMGSLLKSVPAVTSDFITVILMTTGWALIVLALAAALHQRKVKG